MDSNYKTHVTHDHHDKGSILLFVLIVVSMMTALAFGCIYRVQADLKMTYHYARNTQAYYLALGGIERVMALLAEEELTENRVAFISQLTGNEDQDNLFKQAMNDSQADAPTLNYCVLDEQSLFNINGHFADRFEILVGRQCASLILDWTDEDNDPLGSNSAESDYYLRRSVPYRASNRPFHAIRELNYLRPTDLGYTREDINFNLILDENEQDSDTSMPLDNRDGVLDPGLADLFTTVGTDLINLNTASTVILKAIGGLDDPPVTDLIIQHRSGPDGIGGTDDDTCFTTPEDLVLEGLTETQVSILQDTSRFCLTSEHFRIYAYGKTKLSSPCCLMATVHCTDNQSNIIFLERLY